MKKSTKRFMALALGTAMAVSAFGLVSFADDDSSQDLLGSESASIHLKVGTTTAPEGHYVAGLLKMQELLEEYSNGEMTLDIYPNSQLGDERAMIEAVSLGAQDMVLSSTGPLPNYVPDFGALDLPYIFTDSEQAYEVLDGEIGQGLLAQLSSQNIYGVGFWENGFRDTTNNSKEIAVPDDLKGMKIRTMENNVHMATYESWGATATPLAWSEIFTALQQGTVDGQENPIVIIETAKVYEVQKYLTLNDVFYSPCVLMINQAEYEGFTDEQKAAFDQAAEEAKTYQREWSQNYIDTALQTMKDSGVTVTEVDKQVWKDSIDYDAIIKKSGLNVDQTLIDSLLSLSSEETTTE